MMNFSDRITSITDPPAPKGTPQYLTPKQYEALSGEDKRYYWPEYRQYKTKKRRIYEDCDLGHTHYMGWEEYKVPIGAPYRYCWHLPLYPNVVDSILQSNVLASRLISRQGSKAVTDDAAVKFEGLMNS